MKPRILLTGKNGQLGRELSGFLASTSELVALDRRELDLMRPGEVRQVIRSIRPSIIVNAAAYTAVDRAESDEATARVVNDEAPRTMAEEAKALGAILVHYSTDYVFDGAKRTPYVEEDGPNPQSVYGATKLAGERAIQHSGARYLIFRIAWVYGREGRNFVRTILRSAGEREELRVVQDQIGAPTFSREIAATTSGILNGLFGERPFPDSTIDGIYHMTAAGETSWYRFAQAIVKEASRCDPKDPWLAAATGGRPLILRRIIPIGTSEYPTPARRPAYSVLSNARLSRVFGAKLADWQTMLHGALADNPTG